MLLSRGPLGSTSLLSPSGIGDLEETREGLFHLLSSYLGRTWGRRKGPRLFVLFLGGSVWCYCLSQLLIII